MVEDSSDSLKDLDFNGRLSHSQIEKLKNLRTPSNAKSIISISIDWSLIICAFLLLNYSIQLLPITLLIVGSRQRAISNLTHDASHVNLFTNIVINDFISNIFCALPMYETVSKYRESHIKHHRFLGDVERDPDSRSHLNYGYDDRCPWKGSPAKNYMKIILNPRGIFSSFFGSLFRLHPKDYIYLTCWWMGFAMLLSNLFSIQITFIVFGTWHLSKLTTYHLIRIFAEFLDHTGLENSDVISFTRNLPHRGFYRFIFHPNCDTYHIVHHLYPRIPHYNHSKADQILMSRFDYAQSHHCDSYFFGKHSAANCWVGNCREGAK
jgi:fatty acid desaturase